MKGAIHSAVASGHGDAVLTAGFIGLILSDIIPTPGDALYFWDQLRLRKKLENGQITAKQFWAKNAAGYYLYNSAWWALVSLIVLSNPGAYAGKIKLAAGLIGAGAVVGILAKNIQNDQ